MKIHPSIYVILAFLLVIGAWTTIIMLANKYRPEKVPLEHIEQPVQPNPTD